jgi:hypothetical protein
MGRSGFSDLSVFCGPKVTPMQSYLEPLLQRLDAATERANQMFASLDAHQLNWKPNPGRWSIGQCLDHLITTNELYGKTLKQMAAGTYRPGFWAKLGLLSGFFGNVLIQSMGPDMKRKANSPADFRPSESELPGDILQRFLEHQAELKQQLLALPDADHRKIRLSSPAAAFITFSLHDALNIVVGHEERHLLQAQNVMAEEGFPA